jgi:polysaccharide pyruvyl transferase WcaK-like protein
MTTSEIKIGLLWHSAGSGNLGVGALTIANMAIVRNVAATMNLTPRFTIIGMRDSDKSYISQDEAKIFVVDRRSILNPKGCWNLLGAQDCVLDIGAGDSFAEIYGPKRFAFLWVTKAMTWLRGVPLLLSPQTIGPFNKPLYRALAALALRKSTKVIARDTLSLDAIKTLAPDANADLAVDVAFALPFTDRSEERGGAKIRVGVNVSGLLFHEAISGSNRFGLDFDYAELMTSFLDDLSHRSDVELHLVTHATSSIISYDNDASVADDLAKQFPGALRAPDFADPSEAKSYISSLDFLVAGRMHACIAALSSGTAVVPIAYSRKFSGLFGMLDYDHLVPVKGLKTTAALAYLHNALARRNKLAADAQQGMSKVEELLNVYRFALKDLFQQVRQTA